MLSRDKVEEEISGLYLTTIGRSPDSDGVAYWVNEVMLGKLTVAQVGQSFFDQLEVKAKYDGLDTTAFVQAVYQNVLGRDAEQAGLDYWVGQLNNGTFTNDRFIEAVNNGATGDDATRLSNLKDVGFYYMKKIGEDMDLGKSVLSAVTADSSSETEALKLIEYYSQNTNTLSITDLDTVNSWRSLSDLNSIDVTENIGNSSIELWNSSNIFTNETANMYSSYNTPENYDDTFIAPIVVEIPSSSDYVIPENPTPADNSLGLGYPVYLKTKVSTTYSNDSFLSADNYTYTKNDSNNTIHQDFNSDGESASDLTFDTKGNIIKAVDYDYFGLLASISELTYNENNQMTEIFSDIYEEGKMSYTLHVGYSWDENQVVSQTITGTGVNGEVVYGKGKSIGTPLNDTKTNALVVNVDQDGDGITDDITYFTYDAYGNEIKSELDENADGTINETTVSEWVLFG